MPHYRQPVCCRIGCKCYVSSSSTSCTPLATLNGSSRQVLFPILLQPLPQLSHWASNKGRASNEEAARQLLLKAEALLRAEATWQRPPSTPKGNEGGRGGRA
jgi:hypothetical protein